MSNTQKPTVTIAQVIAWEPCGLNGKDDGCNYTPARIRQLFAGRDTLTAGDIANLDISTEDKLWAILRSEFLTSTQLHSLACDFAEHVIHLCGDGPYPARVIAAKRAWLCGEINDEELIAAGAAAGAAAEAAAWSAEKQWQLQHILSLALEEINETAH